MEQSCCLLVRSPAKTPPGSTSKAPEPSGCVVDPSERMRVNASHSESVLSRIRTRRTPPPTFIFPSIVLPQSTSSFAQLSPGHSAPGRRAPCRKATCVCSSSIGELKTRKTTAEPRKTTERRKRVQHGAAMAETAELRRVGAGTSGKASVHGAETARKLGLAPAAVHSALLRPALPWEAGSR